MLPELYSRLADEYGMDIEEARRFVLEKMGDQIIPEPTPPEEEPTTQNWRTDPATEAQKAEIKGLIQALGGDKGQDLTDMMLAFYDKDMDDLNGEEAAAILSALDKAPPELWEAMLAWNKAETLGLSWPEAAILMGAGGAGAGAAVGLSVKSLYTRFGTWAAANLPQRLGVQVVEHGAKVHTLEPAKAGLLSRIFGRFRGGGGGLGGTFVGSTPAFALLAPDPTLTGRGGEGIPTATAQAGLGAGLQVPVLSTTLGGRRGFLDPETGEFKIPRTGLIGTILGPEVISAEEVLRMQEEEATALRAAEIAAANIRAIQRGGPRRTISAPAITRFFQRPR